jgi:hypothetical protein
MIKAVKRIVKSASNVHRPDGRPNVFLYSTTRSGSTWLMELIWSQPGTIRPGQVISPMVSTYDFFPTLLDYLGVRAPDDRRRVGRSYAPFLRGHSPRWRNELYFEYEYVRGIRNTRV